MRRLTIGQLAERFALNTSAIRYYERAGVLPPAEREAGQRRYGPDAVRRLEILVAARDAGFSLAETRLLLERTEAGTPAHTALRELAQRKLPDVEAVIERAQAMHAWLTTAAGCSCASLDACALFDGSQRPAVTFDAAPEPAR